MCRNRAREITVAGNKTVGSMLTYDTTLQVVSWTAQEDLFLNDSLLGGHLFGGFLLAGVEADRRERKKRKRNEGGAENAGREGKWY